MPRTLRIMLLVVTLPILLVGVSEIHHLVRFGHLYPFGLHADVIVRHEDYGIDGITKTYEARLTNYGVAPVWVRECKFLTDVSQGTQTAIGYAVERWNSSDRKWQVIASTQSGFCRPYPLGMVATHIVRKRLWPGQSVSGGEEATAARSAFSIGDEARFVVFADADRVVPTAAFSINEHPKSEVPYRIRH